MRTVLQMTGFAMIAAVVALVLWENRAPACDRATPGSVAFVFNCR